MLSPRRPVAGLLVTVLISLVPVLCPALRAAETVPDDMALPRAEVPDAQNALVRWRAHFPALQPGNDGISGLLIDHLSPLRPAVADPDALLWLDGVRPIIGELGLRDGEVLQLPRIEGPDTPFPDHAPLYQVAVIRANLARRAWAAGDRPGALKLARENLDFARAFLRAQEGVIAMIKASGVWQVSLDTVYWLARQPLTADEAASLQADLEADAALARETIARGFRGEYTFFYKTVIGRMPQTRDADLLLSSLASLAMHPPTPVAPDEQHLALPPEGREPLDREATLRAGAEDIRGYLRVIERTGRFPRGYHTGHTAVALSAWLRELGGFYTYATDEGPFLPSVLAEANAAVLHSENPVGKLFLVLNTPQWEPLMVSIFRREAQRAALAGMLAWRRNGQPAAWDVLVRKGLLAAEPVDPFGNGEPLRSDLQKPRIWSVGIDGVDNGGFGNGENVGQPDDLVWPW
ncbi:hypothetical protein OPIT5_18850 [Opitutaceae bacterium TAV5]|nr:hypothetical protein OPIT5_18850 [Opitutaceae bacterium TAV5]